MIDMSYTSRFQLAVITLFMCIGVVGCYAQSKVGARTFRTLCYFPVKGIQKVHYMSGGKAVEVELPKMNLSRSYKIPASGKILFGEPTEKDGKEVIKPLAIATIPEGGKELLLLFFPASKKDTQMKYQVKVLNYDPGVFANGQYLFLNLSNEDVVGMFGKKRVFIGARKQVKFIPSSGLKDDERYYVNIRSKVNNQWRPLYKSYWYKSGSAKKLGLIYRDPSTKRLRLLCFPYRKDPRDFKEDGR